MKNFVEELRWRGMLAQIMPGAEELLQKEMVTAYLGTDPTADSLHIGHLCGIMLLRHFQRCGHKPIILVGGATGMIGDPSGKSQERNLLDTETLYHNQECIKAQVAKFLDFNGTEPNAAEMVNNYDWMKDFTFLDFARVVGKNITVNYTLFSSFLTEQHATVFHSLSSHTNCCKATTSSTSIVKRDARCSSAATTSGVT